MKDNNLNTKMQNTLDISFEQNNDLETNNEKSLYTLQALEETIINERKDMAALKDELSKINTKLGIKENVISNNVNVKYQKKLEELLPEIKDVEEDIVNIMPYTMADGKIVKKEELLGNIRKAYGYRHISKKYMIDAISSCKKYTMISTTASILSLPYIMPYILNLPDPYPLIVGTTVILAMIGNSATSFLVSLDEYVSNQKNCVRISSKRKYLDINWLLKVRNKGYEKLANYYTKAYNIDLSKIDEDDLKIALKNLINLEKEREILISKIKKKSIKIEKLNDELNKFKAYFEIEYSNLDDNYQLKLDKTNQIEQKAIKKIK